MHPVVTTIMSSLKPKRMTHHHHHLWFTTPTSTNNNTNTPPIIQVTIAAANATMIQNASKGVLFHSPFLQITLGGTKLTTTMTTNSSECCLCFFAASIKVSTTSTIDHRPRRVQHTWATITYTTGFLLNYSTSSTSNSNHHIAVGEPRSNLPYLVPLAPPSVHPTVASLDNTRTLDLCHHCIYAANSPYAACSLPMCL